MRINIHVMMTYTQVQYGILLMTITSNLVINAELHFRSFSDTSHCSKFDLKFIIMGKIGEDFIITWHGGPVVSGCEFFIRTISSTSMLCINLQKITFPCDTETTLTIINQDHDNGPYTLFDVNCHVKPIPCLALKEKVWIELVSRGVNISVTPLLQIQLSLNTTQSKVYVNKNDVTIDSKEETDVVVKHEHGGQCYLPTVESNVYMTYVNGICKSIHCVHCDPPQMLSILANGAFYTKDKPDEPEGLDINKIVAISGGIVTSLFVPVVVIFVRRRNNNSSDKEHGGNRQGDGKTTDNNRDSLLSLDSFKSI